MKLYKLALFSLILLIILIDINLLNADIIDLNDNSNSDLIPIGDQVYQDSENNGIADGLCRALSFMNMIIVPISAISFTVIGLNALNGKLGWSVFITFGLGIGAFKSAGNILDYFIPGFNMASGCKCAPVKYSKDSSGNDILYSTRLTEDCKSF